MFTRMHKCTTIALAVAALAAGEANGGVERGIGDDPVRAPYSDAVDRWLANNAAPPISLRATDGYQPQLRGGETVAVTDGGFDWRDAGLGGALVLALVIGLSGARIVGRRTLRTS
jgi:hypothetical protein